MKNEPASISTRLLVVLGGFVAGILLPLAGCSARYSPVPVPPAPATNHTITLPPQPLMATSQPVARMARTVSAAAVFTGLTLTASSSAPALVIAVAPYGGKGQISLSWNASPDSTTTGYRIYYGTEPGNYTNSVKVGKVLKAPVVGLLEGVKYYFACVAYDGSGTESVFSNETSATTSFYVSIRAANWSVETYGRAGVTNQVLRSTNLVNWVVIKEFVGRSGVLTNIIEPNLVSAYYKVVAKP